MRIPYSDMVSVFSRILESRGMAADDAALAARLFADASADGVHSHGLPPDPADRLAGAGDLHRCQRGGPDQMRGGLLPRPKQNLAEQYGRGFPVVLTLDRPEKGKKVNLSLDWGERLWYSNFTCESGLCCDAFLSASGTPFAADSARSGRQKTLCRRPMSFWLSCGGSLLLELRRKFAPFRACRRSGIFIARDNQTQTKEVPNYGESRRTGEDHPEML